MDYNFFKLAWEMGVCTLTQLKQALNKDLITQEQYNEIAALPQTGVF